MSAPESAESLYRQCWMDARNETRKSWPAEGDCLYLEFSSLPDRMNELEARMTKLGDQFSEERHVVRVVIDTLNSMLSCQVSEVGSGEELGNALVAHSRRTPTLETIPEYDSQMSADASFAEEPQLLRGARGALPSLPKAALLARLKSSEAAVAALTESAERDRLVLRTLIQELGIARDGPLGAANALQARCEAAALESVEAVQPMAKESTVTGPDAEALSDKPTLSSLWEWETVEKGLEECLEKDLVAWQPIKLALTFDDASGDSAAAAPVPMATCCSAVEEVDTRIRRLASSTAKRVAAQSREISGLHGQLAALIDLCLKLQNGSNESEDGRSVASFLKNSDDDASQPLRKCCSPSLDDRGLLWV